METTVTDSDSYVCVTLIVGLVPGYPENRPTVLLKNPRGLSDSTLDSISRNVTAKLDEGLGAPVVFDLIEMVRESLTDSNLPSEQCVICLYGFQEADQFTKTQCFHFLHTYCLLRHLDASRRNYDEEFQKLPGWQQLTAKPYQAACPVCREPIACDRAAMEKANKPPNELVNAPKFKLTAEIRCLQSKMAHLFLHQKERGGIIDVEAEEPQILAIVDPREAEAERERVKQREIAAAAAAVEAEEKAAAAAAAKKANRKKKDNSGHYEHKHKDHHQHYKKGHHYQYNRSHRGHGTTAAAAGNGGGGAGEAANETSGHSACGPSHR